jgi:hypothetical protein
MTRWHEERSDPFIDLWEAATGQLIRRFAGHHSGVDSLSFSSDGLKLASGGGDSTILVWDITGRTGGTPALRSVSEPSALRSAGVPPAQTQLTPRQLETCWNDLANADAAKAYEAVWQLVAASEQAVPFLRRKLPPISRPDAKAIARWIADLDSDDFTLREKATEELRKLGENAGPVLRQTLESKPSAEAQRRIQQLLDQTHDWTPERLREHRALQALEHMGTPSAGEVLRVLAEGAPGASRTEEAKAAQSRMVRTPSPAKNP